MDVANHIKDLLYHHDCIIVPGFGGFFTSELPARIDRASGSFYPPSREVGFDARLDHNDGLLISYLSSRLSLNYVDTRNLVESFAEKVKGKLLSGRTVYFEGVGRFLADRNHNLQFDPDPSANFMTHSYGLSHVRISETGSGKRPGRLPALNGTGDRAFGSIIRRMVRYAAVGIPLIAALSWGAMNTGIVREFNFSISSLNPFSTIIDSDLKIFGKNQEVHALSDPQIAGETGEMTSLRRAMMYVEDQPGDPSGTDAGSSVSAAPSFTGPEPGSVRENVPEPYHLVAGSFKNRQNALFLTGQLERKGYDARIITSDRGMHRVSLYSSGNRIEALRMLRRVRDRENNPDIWLFSN